MQKIGTWPGTKAALEFRVLVACRAGEVQLAERGAVNLESGIWTIPADRAKIHREHGVPLALRGIALLDDMRELSGGDGLIFPSVTGKALSDSTLSKLVREQGIQAIPHRFRYSFRDWCGGTTCLARLRRRVWPMPSRTKSMPPTRDRACIVGGGS